MIPHPPSVAAFDALVAVVQAIRPEWDAAGVRFGIKQALGRPEETTFAQLATVALKCAANKKCQTPATFGFDASWTDKPSGPDDPRKACWTCGKSEEGHNRLAALTDPSDRHVFVTYEDQIVRVAAARAAAEEAAPTTPPAHLTATTTEEPADE